MSRHDVIEALKSEIQDEENVDDSFDGEVEDESSFVRYDITSYGIDFDVMGLVTRVQKGNVFIPSFQRSYVWNMSEASRLIESIIFGLPIPGIFLAQEPNSKKLLVIDGQQRIKTLKFFVDGYFDPKPDANSNRIFKLINVHSSIVDKTFKELSSVDQNALLDSVIHATVVKQDVPEENDTSIYHIFERLNTGGRKLNHQEIRCAVDHGPLVELLDVLNKNLSWRKIYGPTDKRMKDQELIIRFFALLEGYQDYKKPMSDFINRFSKKYRMAGGDVGVYSDCFERAINLFHEAVGDRVFRVAGPLNVAVYDAAMCGLARRILTGASVDSIVVASAYQKLIEDELVRGTISQGTTDVSSVVGRIERAIEIFKEA
ncbi:DUF262 domain-containing protein [Chromobacterium violaceum]|uniref:DUF262 domain-containing protein n=1 Tax=Chromobacterium violaceum TaxID=536 RepID=UPI003DA913D2